MASDDHSESVAIFWDYENCPVPSGCSGYDLVDAIRQMVRPFGSVKLFKAYLEVSEQTLSSRSLTLRSELQSSGVSLTDCPHNGGKDSADKMMIVDMLTHAIDHAPPSTFLLISGDRDFAYALSTLRMRRYNVILVTLPNAHRSLTMQATTRLDWYTDVVDLIPSALRSPKKQAAKLLLPPPPSSPTKKTNGGGPAVFLFGKENDGGANSNSGANKNVTNISSSSGPGLFTPIIEENDNAPSTAQAFSFNVPASSPTKKKVQAKAPVPQYSVVPSHSPFSPPASPVKFSSKKDKKKYDSESYLPPSAPTSVHQTKTSFQEVAVKGENGDYAAVSNFSFSSIQLGSKAKSKISQQKPLAASSRVNLDPEDTPVPSSAETSEWDASSSDDNSKRVRKPAAPPKPVRAMTTSPSSASASSTFTWVPEIGTAKVVPDHMKALVRQLQYYQGRGTYIVLRSVLGADLMNRYKGVYKRAGVSGFSAYVQLAEEQGIVELGGMGGEAWIRMCAGYETASTKW